MAIRDTSKPLVSVIIPLYNAEKYISETLENVLNQTWTNLEILVIDDGSNDNSYSIAKKFTPKGVKVFQQSNNGAGAARNYGIREAKGDFVQFLDADDLLSDNKIEAQVTKIQDEFSKVAVCSTVHFFDGGNPFTNCSSPYEDNFLYSTDSGEAFLISLYGGNNNGGSMIQTNAWLVPMSIIKKVGPWTEFYSPDDDGEYFCRIMLAGSGIVYVKGCFNYYRKYKNDSNLASTKTKMALEGAFQSLLLKQNHLKNSKNPKAKVIIARAAMELAVQAYPAYKPLTNDILSQIKQHETIAYVPIIGGKLIEIIKKNIGWKAARTLQYYKEIITNLLK